jgi:hypothetical protein
MGIYVYMGYIRSIHRFRRAGDVDGHFGMVLDAHGTTFDTLNAYKHLRPDETDVYFVYIPYMSCFIARRTIADLFRGNLTHLDLQPSGVF